MIVSEKFRIFASGNANRVDWQLLMWTKERRRYEKGIYCCDYFVRCGVKKKIAEMGAEKLSELGIEGVDAATLEKLGADVDLTEVTDLGKDVVMNTAGFYLQSHMRVDDYYVATVGMLNYKGVNLPVTLGILGKVYVLVDEEQVKRMVRQ